MRRIMSMLLALLLVISLFTGCTKKEDPTIVDENQSPVTTPVEDSISVKDAMALIEDNADAILLVDMRAKEDYDKLPVVTP